MTRSFAISGVVFGRALLGVAFRPYETYRRIIDRASSWELIYIAVFVSAYCFIARIQVIPVIITYCVTVGLFWSAGKLLGATGRPLGFMVGWAYTLIPTLFWFWGTNLLYILVPPPRTTSPQGLILSIVYLLFCATLLFWKVTVSYLALRFGLRLDLGKITLVCAIVLPILGAYSVFMYRFGIFRIPFL